MDKYIKPEMEIIQSLNDAIVTSGEADEPAPAAA